MFLSETISILKNKWFTFKKCSSVFTKYSWKFSECIGIKAELHVDIYLNITWYVNKTTTLPHWGTLHRRSGGLSSTNISYTRKLCWLLMVLLPIFLSLKNSWILFSWICCVWHKLIKKESESFILKWIFISNMLACLLVADPHVTWPPSSLSVR